MKNSTKNLFKYLLEFLIVGFGVFLGIYVSEWKSNRKTIEKKEQSINYIIEELELNKNNLLRNIEYHEMIKIGFDSLKNTLSKEDKLEVYLDNEKSNHNQIQGWVGIGLPNFDDIAFEGVKLSGIVQEYDFELLQAISKPYKQQKTISELGESITNKIVAINSTTKVADIIKIIELITTDFVNMERALHNEYVQTIDLIKNDIQQQ